jgi:hypothetical protein
MQDDVSGSFAIFDLRSSFDGQAVTRGDDVSFGPGSHQPQNLASK